MNTVYQDIGISENGLEIQRKEKAGLLLPVFAIWTLVLLCRPQDYLTFLGALRPNLTLGPLALLIYFMGGTKREKISDSRQFRLYRYLLAVIAISVPFSYYKSYSMLSLISYATVSFTFFFLFYQLVNTTARLRNMLFLYCIGIGIYAFYILKSGSFADERISFGSMFDSNDTAYFIISFLSFNLLFISKDNAGYKRIIAVANIIVSVIVILKTGSRGGLISLISVFTYLMFAKTITFKLSFMKKVVLVIVALASLHFVDINSKRFDTLFDMKDDYNVTDEEGRLAIWGIGMKMMLSRPLTGVGMNMFGAGVARDRAERGITSGVKWQTAHNSIVQIGAETGIFGLMLFILMSSNVFRITGQIIRKYQSEELIKISEMTKASFLGSFISAMFLSQAYSIYWVFYIILSSVIYRIYEGDLLSTSTPYKDI